MAIVPVQKVLVVFHKDIKEEFIAHLQKEGIIHITEMKEVVFKTLPAIENLNEAITHLKAYEKKNPLENFVAIKRVLSLVEFEEKAGSYDYKKVIERLNRNRKEHEEILEEMQNLKNYLNLLTPWKRMEYSPNSLKDFKTVEGIGVIIQSPKNYDKLLEKIAGIPHSFEQIDIINQRIYGLFFLRKCDVPQLKKILLENNIEITEFPPFAEKPKELVDKFTARIEELKNRLTHLEEEVKQLSQELQDLKLAYDLYYNQFKREVVVSSLPETTRTINIIGWVKRKDLKKLERIVKEHIFAGYEIISPLPDEKPPVAIENSWWNSCYEMLVRLYSMPDTKEFDPTPFIAIFFPLFFGLCLTDAIYGIFLAIFSLFLMRKVSGDKNLLWILFVGGIATIFTGSIVGGWAGNLFDLIGIPFLKDFKNRLMLFDPLTNPMPFFYLALGVGYLHVMLGVLIEVYDDLRNRDYARAIFENLTWFILVLCLPLYFIFLKSPILKFLIILSITGIVLFSSRTDKPPIFDQILWSLFIFLSLSYLVKFLPPYFKFAICGLLVIGIFRFKNTKKILGRIAWGLYNLYGLTSFVSNILSYVRLMALGMVTGGIAMTVNMIAWMVIKIPFMGIILGIIILIVGHSFNIVINSLGGFIHTMRLHYIEFFGRFYQGGGKQFRPFGLETKYVEVIR